MSYLSAFLPRIANRFLLILSFLTKKEEVKGFPVEIGIELTNRCNLACLMCPHQEMIDDKIRPLGIISETLFKKIIDQVAPFSELVYLHGLGESLLHPKLIDFIKYAKSKGVRVGLSTNVTLLNKKMSKELMSSGLDYIILAIDGETKKTYEGIRRGANFEIVESNALNFLKEKKQSKNSPFCVIQFITMEENEIEKQQFYLKWKNKGVNAIRIKPKNTFKVE